jgi:hypothetical protein
MSDEWDPDWWRKAKAQTVQRKRNTPATASTGDAILIVTEGTVTEPTYFKVLRKELRLSAVKVVIAPGATSAPLSVVNTAAYQARMQQSKKRRGKLNISDPAKFDQVWAVVDTDAAVRGGIWQAVQSRAKSLHVLLADSTPSFEYWFLLHLRYCTPHLASCAHAVRELEKELGFAYEKSPTGYSQYFAEVVKRS